MADKSLVFPDDVVPGSDMAEAISSAAHKLLDAEIVNDSGYAALMAAARNVRKSASSKDWAYSIDRGEPVTFKPSKDKNGNAIHPRIVCAGVTVKHEDHDRPPFDKLDIALEIDDDDGLPISRWHIDVANRSDVATQPGPWTHIQYGGHNHGHRHLDHPLKVPRWCHPPMEVLLLCEVVAANFYTENWQHFLRDDPTWCWALGCSQRLCYAAYLEKLVQSLNISNQTMLHSVWAADWLSKRN